jgi:hypothetical protein
VNEAPEPGKAPAADVDANGAVKPGEPASGPAVQARVTEDGVILAVDQQGKVFRCLQINCWHCFARCPRRL